MRKRKTSIKMKKAIIEKFIIIFLLIFIVSINKANSSEDYPIVKYQPNKRDIFRSPFDALDEMPAVAVKTEIVLPKMSLEGFTWGYEPRAIINTQVVKKGDKILGAEVLEIKKEGVILIYQGKVFTLRPARYWP